MENTQSKRARVPWNVIREVEDDLARYRGEISHARLKTNGATGSEARGRQGVLLLLAVFGDCHSIGVTRDRGIRYVQKKANPYYLYMANFMKTEDFPQLAKSPTNGMCSVHSRNS